MSRPRKTTSSITTTISATRRPAATWATSQFCGPALPRSAPAPAAFRPAALQRVALHRAAVRRAAILRPTSRRKIRRASARPTRCVAPATTAAEAARDPISRLAASAAPRVNLWPVAPARTQAARAGRRRSVPATSAAAADKCTPTPVVRRRAAPARSSMASAARRQHRPPVNRARPIGNAAPAATCRPAVHVVSPARRRRRASVVQSDKRPAAPTRANARS
jgi:hypothetical protein